MGFMLTVIIHVCKRTKISSDTHSRKIVILSQNVDLKIHTCTCTCIYHVKGQNTICVDPMLANLAQSKA